VQSSSACLPCALNQCRQIVRLTGGDLALEERVLGYIRDGARALDFCQPPSTYTSHILLTAMGLLDEPDPFRQTKEHQNSTARPIAEALDVELDRSEHPLKSALLLAAAGNVIDSGPGHKHTLDDALRSLQFAHDDSDSLIRRLEGCRSITYILDNAGEVMFDMLVLRRLPSAEITIVAKSGPILNDLTVEEARQLGLGRFGRVIATGSRLLGIDAATVSDEFRRAWLDADVVIAKGHANFESLVHSRRDGFYVLKAKCDLVATELGVKPGDSVCYYSKGRP
jgi:uncharacterized protein with ATP-grasp and redox domains